MSCFGQKRTSVNTCCVSWRILECSLMDRSSSCKQTSPRTKFQFCPIIVTNWRKLAWLDGRLVTEYRMIGMIRIPREYGRYMHQYTYSMYICWYVCMFLLCLPAPQPPYKELCSTLKRFCGPSVFHHWFVSPCCWRFLNNCFFCITKMSQKCLGVVGEHPRPILDTPMPLWGLLCNSYKSSYRFPMDPCGFPMDVRNGPEPPRAQMNPIELHWELHTLQSIIMEA